MRAWSRQNRGDLCAGWPARAAVLVVAVVVELATSCSKPEPSPTPQTAVPAAPLKAAAAPVKHAPPRGTYVPAKTWRAQNKAGTTHEPPPAADEVWRAFVNRQHPIQRKTPKWVPLPAADNVELEMPPNSRYHCLVTPLEIITDTNDFSTKLKAWVLTRYLRCSPDGWQTWTEYMERVRVAPDGTREVIQSAEAVLHELPPEGEPAEPAQHDILVLVKPDRENRAASPGPPKIMPGVVVDED